MSFFYVILPSEMTYKKRKKGLVLLADGTIFYGRSTGINGTSFGEICFNTGVTGYQEIFTDPSYFGQIMVTTTSHIGNYGIKMSESQSNKIYISGLICKNFSSVNSRSNSESIKKWLINLVFPGFEEVFANFLLLVSIFIKDDFPTLLLPMKAYSGKLPFGQSLAF